MNFSKFWKTNKNVTEINTIFYLYSLKTIQFLSNSSDKTAKNWILRKKIIVEEGNIFSYKYFNLW